MAVRIGMAAWDKNENEGAGKKMKKGDGKIY